MSTRLLALAAALILLCSGCATSTQQVSLSTPPEQSVPEGPPPQQSSPDLSAPPQVSAPAEPAPDPVPTTDPEPTPDPEPAPVDSVPVAPTEPSVPASQFPTFAPAITDFSVPVPESQAVSIDYFADAAFVGDSRTEGFWLYSGIKQGTLISATGLTVFTLDTKTAFNSSQTVLQALSSGEFGKIYLSLGINEMGYMDAEAFVAAYCDLIDTIRAAHPNTIIYIQNLVPVNNSKARSSGYQGHVNCDRIRLYNELIAQVARDKQVPLLDLYSAFAVDGQLPADASRDGVHLLPAACKKQLTYLTTHTVGQAPQPAPDPTTPQPTPEPAPESADAPVPEPSTETEVAEL